MGRLYKKCVLFCAFYLLGVCAGRIYGAQAAVRLNQTDATICVGQGTKLKVLGTTKRIKWSSANGKIAKVDSLGEVTGLKSGETVINASVGKKQYQCKLRVNATYGAETSAIKIKKQKAVNIMFTENASVTFQIQNTSICGAAWGKWSGNEVSLLITPKKVGETVVTCSNTANAETIQIAVTVTKVPVNVTDISVATTDKGELVYGMNKAQISFKQDRKSKKTVLYIINRDGDTVRTMDLGAVTTKRYKATWDGTEDDGSRYSGGYRVRVSADGYVTDSMDYQVCYAQNPFNGGTGSKKSPFEVATSEQLKKMTSYQYRYFKQTSDIDLQSNRISGIFQDKEPFCGLYDGAGYKIKNCYESESLFGFIATEGALQNIELESFRMQLSGKERAAFLAEKNMGMISNCRVVDGLIRTMGMTDVAMLVVENDGIIQNCSVEGKLYGYGSMAGCALRNMGRLLDCTAAVDFYFSMPEGVATGSALSALMVGGIVGENTGSAFLNACKSDQSSLNASGVVATPFILYMGGIAAKNQGQIQEGSFLGMFSEKQTKDLEGVLCAGMVVGENQGIVSEVSYYQTDSRESVGSGMGTVIDLHGLPNPYEEQAQ